MVQAMNLSFINMAFTHNYNLQFCQTANKPQCCIHIHSE